MFISSSHKNSYVHELELEVSRLTATVQAQSAALHKLHHHLNAEQQVIPVDVGTKNQLMVALQDCKNQFSLHCHQLTHIKSIACQALFNDAGLVELYCKLVALKEMQKNIAYVQILLTDLQLSYIDLQNAESDQLQLISDIQCETPGDAPASVLDKVRLVLGHCEPINQPCIPCPPTDCLYKPPTDKIW